MMMNDHRSRTQLVKIQDPESKGHLLYRFCEGVLPWNSCFTFHSSRLALVPLSVLGFGVLGEALPPQ